MKKILAALAAVLFALTLGACSSKAQTVNHNLDKEADSFHVYRKVSFVNGITDKEMLRIQGYCSARLRTKATDVTCKVPGGYVRNTITKSDNSFVVIEQVDPADVSDTHYKIILRPGTAIPNLDIQ